ncbi:subtilase-type protease inhibitor [Streptomyces sp. NPDC101151]|uniref:subtilase-type protease inhibitor n=1 Tax=Streptomyces sp. NPDC101151 TaxID=3366115 RepID=UPI00380EDC75
MRNTARWAAILGLTATALGTPLAGQALAAPATPNSLYAPSVLVLTVGHGANADTATPQRAVTLNCAPAPSGTHPAAADACAELNIAKGDFSALPASGNVWCTKIWKPVVVTAQGVWQGKRVSYEHTFPNECMKNASQTRVFDF